MKLKEEEGEEEKCEWDPVRLLIMIFFLFSNFSFRVKFRIHWKGFEAF
jgi:hypothetical protein